AGLERLGERVDGGGGDEDVPLRRVARAGVAAGPVVTLAPGVGRAAAAAVDHPDLAVVAPLVGGGEPLDRLARGAPSAEEREPVRPVARVRVRLPRERLQHLLLRSRPDDDRPALVVRDAERLDVVHAVEDERVLVDGDGRISFDGDLGDLEPRGAEPALPQTVTDSPGSSARTSTW